MIAFKLQYKYIQTDLPMITDQRNLHMIYLLSLI